MYKRCRQDFHGRVSTKACAFACEIQSFAHLTTPSNYYMTIYWQVLRETIEKLIVHEWRKQRSNTTSVVIRLSTYICTLRLERWTNRNLIFGIAPNPSSFLSNRCTCTYTLMHTCGPPILEHNNRNIFCPIAKIENHNELDPLHGRHGACAVLACHSRKIMIIILMSFILVDLYSVVHNKLLLLLLHSSKFLVLLSPYSPYHCMREYKKERPCVAR